jgi:hypothetical protein
MALQAKVFQPVDRFVLRSRADRNRNVDWNSAPLKVGRQQNQVRLVRPHPFRKGTFVGEPTANELLAWIHRAFFINAAPVPNTERTRVARKNIATADIDFQPAVTTGGAFGTCPRDIRLISRH